MKLNKELIRLAQNMLAMIRAAVACEADRHSDSVALFDAVSALINAEKALDKVRST